MSDVENSHVFIGHAYGSPFRKFDIYKGFLALNVLNFLQENMHKLPTVSFTGDLFAIPSLAKRERLRSLTESHMVFIAPGNHDVGRPDSLDVFNFSPFAASYPFVENFDGVPVVYDDSVSSNWLISGETLELVNSLASQNVIIARHNIPFVELLKLANSSAGMAARLPDLNELIKKFHTDVNYTWLIGDSGAIDVPRLSCVQYLNHTFIVNGIGEVSGDTFVIFKDGKFYSHEL